MERILLMMMLLGVAQGGVITVWRIQANKAMFDITRTASFPDVYQCITFCLSEKAATFRSTTGGRCDCHPVTSEEGVLWNLDAAQFAERQLVTEGALFVMMEKTENSRLITGTSEWREGDADVVAVLSTLDPVDSSVECNAQCQRVADCDAVIFTPSGRCHLLWNLVIL